MEDRDQDVWFGIDVYNFRVSNLYLCTGTRSSGWNIDVMRFLGIYTWITLVLFRCLNDCTNMEDPMEPLSASSHGYYVYYVHRTCTVSIIAR